MSDEKPKPFAKAMCAENGRPFLYVDRVGSVSLHPAADAEICAGEINAAVERREAKLRGAAIAIAKRHQSHWLKAAEVDGVNAGGDGDSVYARDQHQHRTMASVARDIAEELAALDGTGPDYVPRAELEAEQAKVKQLQTVLDVLDDVRREPHATPADMTEVVREAVARLEGAGLRKAKRDGHVLADLVTLFGEMARTR